MNAIAVEELIRRELPAATSGDAHAFGRIVAASQNTVTAVALAITRDVPLSEDIAQEAFLNAWQNLRRLQNPASFLPWLRQITRNLAHDHLRAHGRRRAVDDAEAAIEAAADPQPTPVDRLIEAEQQAVAADLISALPDESREVLLLYYREGQSSQQVATLLGLSDAAVRKRLSRARASVREDLLRRFAEFARRSAPGTAFAAVVTAALGAAKPASAMGTLAAGSAVAGATMGKVVAGTLSGLWGVFGAVGGIYFSAKHLLSFAETAQDRKAILRWLGAYTFANVGTAVGAILVYHGYRHWELVALLLVLGLAVVNYQLLRPLPRLMRPLLERDAVRRPEGARRRQRIYWLLWGAPGIVLSNLGLIGALWLAVASGRLT